ncbi:hypothetical protein Desca_1636 [Desulfotomaculum nigrificans CO-1-SRB]|uniref:Uncharacterized protein n=3 Tax=Eubacteriales TaxID=186802 RepID=K8DWQ8_9FIRM|nr:MULTISPECIES: hypothetical protein [Eubacteriales]AEF94484.1 hypothetical protein Desca_1636 [Desulfotomaculum nigrificans CO-1-SRB]AQS59637.1 hypothetical protein B0537_11440 [Desulforamulus ferrireducens]CCO06849.1 conserved hypothetical protein [Desulforamulus hydrothermalis Lam5 = DSM 18033]SHH44453.1 hypothetical protein SAMN02745177_02572 [Desulforamulus hydrothermalis Lam5 = DSM 18033]
MTHAQMNLKKIQSQMTLAALVHEFGPEHPKVTNYRKKLHQLTHEMKHLKACHFGKPDRQIPS